MRGPAGRRIPRPTRVVPCPSCGADAVGLNYRSCPACFERIEGIWEADWSGLLADEGVQPGTGDEALLAKVVVAELDTHLWTVVDMALKRSLCPECGQELGGGPAKCDSCRFTFGNLWWHDVEAGQQGAMTQNEHALRVGRYVVRHPWRYSAVVAEGWRLNMPRMLTGWLPDGAAARAMADRMKAGEPVDWAAVYRAIDAAINAAINAGHS